MDTRSSASDVRNSVLYCIVEYEYGTNSRQVYQELLEKHMIAYSKLWKIVQISTCFTNDDF